jgi:NTE family protein
MENKKIWGYAASGGGGLGAWGGGVSEHLTTNLKRNYQCLSGTSTGSLLMNLVALKKIDILRTAYTTVNNKDIYTTEPYRVISINDGLYKEKLNLFNIFYNVIIKKQKTFGDSTNLRTEVIPKFFTEDDFLDVLRQGKDLIACVTNITLGRIEYHSCLDENTSYNDFLDWIWASCCAAPFMSIVEKRNCEYADGGYLESVPVQPLIDKGCTHIDMILNQHHELSISKVRGPFQLIGRLIDIMVKEEEDIERKLSVLKTNQDVIINVYKPGKRLTTNTLLFNQDVMNKWWNIGYEYAKNNEPEKWKLSKGKKPILL